MKKKKSFVGIVIAIVILAIIICLAFVIIKNWQSDNPSNTINPGTTTGNNANNTEIEQKGWDTQIVVDLASNDVPIPSGFSIAQDDSNSGVIVQDEESGMQYLFIPYQENVNNDVSEYYANITATSMESDIFNSVQKYGGFFVLLNSSLTMDDLKTINQEDYDFQSEQMYLNSYTFDSVNSHILSKEEIAQILAYVDTIELGENTIGAQALVVESFSTLNVEIDETENVGVVQNDTTLTLASVNPTVSYVSENSVKKIATGENEKKDHADYADSGYVYMLESDFYPTDVPIPAGFKYCETNGVVSIQDSNNPNLIYIWVPLDIDEDATPQKEALKRIYENYTDADGDKYSFAEDTELYKVFNDTTEVVTQEYSDSVKQYGGFYLSEAEFGYDADGEYYNKARGMVDYSATNTINGGDYYRDTTTEGLTFAKMREIANGVYDDTASVVSHMAYGLEYDATMLWIADSYRNFKDTQGNDINAILVANSSEVGKYSNSNLSSTATIFESSAYFNGLWGLAGNLAEVTPEIIENSSDQHILRGGSFVTTGEDAPMASRKISDTTQGDNIGFRTALYVKADLRKAKKAGTYEYTYSNDTVIKDNNIEFTLTGNSARWTNDWDGAPVYEKPDVSSKVLGTLPFASEITIDAKANSEITSKDGEKIVWVRALAENDSYVYLNANDLTDSSVTIGDDITFVKGGGVTRYYKSGMVIYEEPSDSSNKVLTTTYVGAITTIGKSVNQTWAIINVDGTEYFVHADDLTPSANTKDVNNIRFVIGDSQTRYVLQDNATVYSQPGNNNTLTTLEYADTVTIKAKSEDGTWAEVTVNNSTGYIHCDLLTTEKLEPKPEPEPEPEVGSGSGNNSTNKPSAGSSGSTNTGGTSTPTKDPTPVNSTQALNTSKSKVIKVTDKMFSYDNSLTESNVKLSGTTLYIDVLTLQIYFECYEPIVKNLKAEVNGKNVAIQLHRKDSSGKCYYSISYSHSSTTNVSVSYRISNSVTDTAVGGSIRFNHILSQLSRDTKNKTATLIFPQGQYFSHTKVQPTRLYKMPVIGYIEDFDFTNTSKNTYVAKSLPELILLRGDYKWLVHFSRNKNSFYETITFK